MEALILGADKALVFPAGNGQRSVVFDMSSVFKAESRLVELTGVSRDKAGELVYTFIEAWDKAKGYLARANSELLLAKQKNREVRATIILDEAAAELDKRKLLSTRSPSGSEDQRDAVVQVSPLYQKTVETLAQISAVVEYLEGKVEKFRMAYFTVNKLIEPPRPVTGVSGGTGDEDVGVLSEQEKAQKFVEEVAGTKTPGFGNARF